MTWAKVDDGLYDDPRFEVAGLEAMGLWVAALSYCGRYLTDGVIDEGRVKKLAGRRAPALTERLIAAGWWRREGGGKVRLISWDSYLLSREEVEAERARKSEAGRRGAERTNAKRLGSGAAGAAASDAAGDGGTRGAPVPVPVPSRSKEEDPPKPPDGGQGFKLDPTEPKKSRAKKAATKDASKPSAAVAYLDAFVAGVGDAGHPVTRPKDSSAPLLGNACRTHAKLNGQPIVGAALPPWIRSEAAAFRRAVSQPQFWKGGISVVGLIAWWDAGRPVQAPTFRPNEEVDDPDTWDPPQPEPPKFPPRPLPPNATAAMRDSGLAYARATGMIPERPHG